MLTVRILKGDIWTYGPVIVGMTHLEITILVSNRHDEACAKRNRDFSFFLRCPMLEPPVSASSKAETGNERQVQARSRRDEPD
jgi:hypothetical protein